MNRRRRFLKLREESNIDSALGLNREISKLSQRSKVSCSLRRGLSYNDMVEHLDLDQLAGTNQIASYLDIAFGRRGVAARMIVLCDPPVYVESVMTCSQLLAPA